MRFSARVERPQRCDAKSQRVFLVSRENMAALHTGKVAAGAILLEDEIAVAMWAGFEQQHGGPPFRSHSILIPGNRDLNTQSSPCVTSRASLAKA
jgi:hypothetical protein